MKKIIMTFVAMLMLAICSICNASPGKVLDAEIGVVEKFLTAKEFKVLEPMCTPDFKKEFTAKDYENFKKTFGNSTKNKFLELTKFDDADILKFIAAFEKQPDVVYLFSFEVKNEKPMLAGIDFQVVQKQQAAGK